MTTEQVVWRQRDIRWLESDADRHGALCVPRTPSADLQYHEHLQQNKTDFYTSIFGRYRRRDNVFGLYMRESVRSSVRASCRT